VVVAVVALLCPTTLPAGPPPAEAQTGGEYQQVLDLTVPVAGPTVYEDDYDEPRDGRARVHQATDLYGAKLQRVHAAAAGTVCGRSDAEARVGGYQLVICGDDGRRYVYTHLNDDSPGTDDGAGGLRWAFAPAIREGVRVVRGQWLGYIGDSGNAEEDGAQLHFGITDPRVQDPALDAAPYEQGRLNPYPSIRAAYDRGDAPAEPTPGRRLAGPSRLETAVAASAGWPEARTVVVAPAGSHAGALAAAPLAGLLEAPTLLAFPEGLADSVKDEIARLGARQAWLVGRDGELGPGVEQDLRQAGVEEIRVIAGAGAAALSAEVARALVAGGAPGRQVLLAVGEADDPARAWPDALSAGALAAQRRTPVLLTRGDALPESVRRVLQELRPNRIEVVGGAAAISDDVAAAAADAAGGAEVVRLAGATRYGTSAAVADAAIAAGLDEPAVWLATGGSYPDALSAGPAAARAGAPLLLIDGARAAGAPEADRWLAGAAGRVTSLAILGGAAAIAPDAAVYAGEVLAG